MSLIVPFDMHGVPSRTAEELESVIAALQTWSRTLETQDVRLRTTIDAAQTIPNNTDAVPIVWATTSSTGLGFSNGDLRYSVGDLLDADGKTIRLTKPGIYTIRASVSWTANATGFRYIGIFESANSGELALVQQPASSAGNALIHQVSMDIVMDTPGTAKTYFIGVFQSSGGNLDTGSNFRTTWLQVTKVT